MLNGMGNIISTITSKWQVTIPEDVRKEIPLKVGQRIVWEVEGGKLVGTPHSFHQRTGRLSEIQRGCQQSEGGARSFRRGRHCPP